MGQQTLPPGFRFSPTDEELVLYYLRSKALGRKFHQATITDVDVYKFEPWDLPGKSLPSKDQEWYFFSAQDKKYSHTARINRTTKKGYWKATGKDRKVFSGSSIIGLKKTLIYYEGRAPNGKRTNWIMHEYRLDEEFERKEHVVCVAVLCRIRKKGGPGPRNGEQYGAPMFDESGELEEEASMGKVEDGVDTSRQYGVEKSRGGGNVFNLTDQVEVWKQMGSSNVALDHISTKENKEPVFPKIESECSDSGNAPNRKGTVECDPELYAYFQSISDTPYFDSAPPYEYSGYTFPSYHQYPDVQNLGTAFDLDGFSPLSTFLDANGNLIQDYTSAAFDESEIIREMSELINDGKGVVGSAGSMMRQTTCNAPLDGGYIELDDIKAPPDGFAVRPPIHSSEFGRFEEQQPWFNSDTSVEKESLLHSRGSAAHRAWLPTRAEQGRHEEACIAYPEVQQLIHGGDISIPISKEPYRNSGKHSSGLHSGAGDPPQVFESSTKSYLSKHVATYAVSKHEMLPAQLCYASSFKGIQNSGVAVNNPLTAPPRAFAMKSGKRNIDVDTLRKLSTTQGDLPTASSLPTKCSSGVAVRAPTHSPQPCRLPPKSSSSSSTNVGVASATQACDEKAEYADMSHRDIWKARFRVFVSKAKRSALKMRWMELENGMRAKFNDKLSGLGKPAGRSPPSKDNTSPFESLMQGLLAILCHLIAAAMVFFSLIWGFRVLVSYASSVPV